ncbi:MULTISPECIES: sulfurtransferase [unclassified Lysobacter]|uniref:sulfurtransferase n=1 Tax=unclassified Lysobacter TaxID=2635362 RepID=UPI001BE70256|nr:MULTISPECIES: sulfurtransferase [unclassified Lysobacter]MBT2746178.1 sulfurtransferase [Lysobacter sp. ISL-42]MBT2753176.1 sulfurtransferase [Lysobacter sp. ISL-50]MBT2776890.1 sulfurtransferase [Lysobacter sp. ISL-54]MBT2782363.1 sulfurtransferase [Lysobacter sp. ISL-52]
MTAWTTLVSAEDLAAALGREDLIVIDTRTSLTDRAASENAYRQSHIPGARYADLDRDLSDHRKTSGGRHPWPDAADFTATLGRWGVTPQHQVVVYDAADGALAASRLWFLLRVLGHRRVAVLDGGWQRWSALGLPADAGIPAPQATHYQASFDARRLLDAQDVRALLDSGGLLIDARAGERFRGEVEPLDRVAGHVPGASHRAYSANLADGRFKSPQTLASEFAPLLGGREPAQVAAMCGSGVTACHHLLAMAHAGFDGAALYTGSWSGWIEDSQRPIATGEG